MLTLNFELLEQHMSFIGFSNHLVLLVAVFTCEGIGPFDKLQEMCH